MHDVPDGDPAGNLLIEAQRAVGEQLRALRANRQLSQRAVADYAGVHQSEWSRLEAGEIDPRLSWLLRVQQMFGVESLESLFGSLPSARLLRADAEAVGGQTNSPRVDQAKHGAELSRKRKRSRQDE